MKPEHIQGLREDFPDLISSSTAFSEGLPDAWLPSLRVLLTNLRAVKFGRRPGTVACDISLRSLGTRIVSHSRRPFYQELNVVLAVVGQSRTAVRSEVRNAVAGCRIADLTRLREAHALDIVEGAVQYVRAVNRAGRKLDAREVVTTSAYDPDEVRYFMSAWSLDIVQQWIKGEPLRDLTESEKSCYISIMKSEE